MVLFIISALLLGLYTCNNSSTIQTVTPLPAPPTVTTTSVSATIEYIEPTATPYLWLPYNPNASNKGCEEFTATIPIKGTKGWSEEKITQALFEVYLDHFMSPELGGICRLENFRIENVLLEMFQAFKAKEYNVDFIRAVEYSVQVKESPANWVAANGELAENGWVIRKLIFVGVTKAGDQYILHLLGTGI